MNPPGKGNSADFPGFASKVIEENLGDGVLAFFVQGCAGDINPVRYKEVNRPADAAELDWGVTSLKRFDDDEKKAVAALCHTLMNTSEYLYTP